MLAVRSARMRAQHDTAATWPGHTQQSAHAKGPGVSELSRQEEQPLGLRPRPALEVRRRPVRSEGPPHAAWVAMGVVAASVVAEEAHELAEVDVAHALVAWTQR